MKELVIVTGMSGAGKTTAMAIFESMEYQCIDNYPVPLLSQFVNLLKDSDRYQKVALALNLTDAYEAFRILEKTRDFHFTKVFLDCEDAILLTRYKFTRRVHPLLISNTVQTLTEAIRFERELSLPIKQEADILIDTSKYTKPKLQEHMERLFILNETDPLRISFVSFGYKYGIPRDADLLFDVRFLPNPYYLPELRNLTGNDKEVYDYVMDKPETQEFVERMNHLFDYFFENYDQEGKMHLVVGVGCTGGQHRSVTLANYFAKHYAKKYHVHVMHRDADH